MKELAGLAGAGLSHSVTVQARGAGICGLQEKRSVQHGGGSEDNRVTFDPPEYATPPPLRQRDLRESLPDLRRRSPLPLDRFFGFVVDEGLCARGAKVVLTVMGRNLVGADTPIGTAVFPLNKASGCGAGPPLFIPRAS